MDLAAIHNALLAEAQADTADHRQYDGYFDCWEVAIATQTITSKWGDVMAVPGDFLLIEPVGRLYPSSFTGITVFFPARSHWTGRGTCTTVSRSVVERVGAVA